MTNSMKSKNIRNSIRLDVPENDIPAVRYSNLRNHPTLDIEMANICLVVGEFEVQLSFYQWSDMIRFCEKHNFPYSDDRNPGHVCPSLQSETGESA